MSRYSLFLLLALIPLAACSNAKEKLGLNKQAPDEFQVVKRAPLAMPPDYDLRPPQPGAPRPQEQAVFDTARETVFGADSEAAAPAPASSAAETLLQQAGATRVDASIRSKVDAESKEDDGVSKKPVIKRIMNIGGDEEPVTTVVDPAKEAERLKSNAEAGKPVTAGETPSKEE
jgi:hypothetical protein